MLWPLAPHSPFSICSVTMDWTLKCFSLPHGENNVVSVEGKGGNLQRKLQPSLPSLVHCVFPFFVLAAQMVSGVGLWPQCCCAPAVCPECSLLTHWPPSCGPSYMAASSGPVVVPQLPLHTCTPPAWAHLPSAELFPPCPVVVDQLSPGQPSELLHHPVGCSHIFSSEIWSPAFGMGPPFQVCLSWVFSFNPKVSFGVLLQLHT